MGHRTALAVLAASLFCAIPVQADEAGQPLSFKSVLSETQGHWQGNMQYREGLSDNWINVPAEMEISIAGDGVTLIRQLEYHRTPGSEPDYMTSLEMLDESQTGIAFTELHAGAEPTVARQRISQGQLSDPHNWMYVYFVDGTDGERPVMKRVTVIRDEDTLASVTEVDFTDEDGTNWQQSSRTSFTRVAGD